MHLTKPKKEVEECSDNTVSNVLTVLGIAALYGIAASLFFTRRTKRPTGKKIDIEIRYNVEKDADTAFLAQNLVKIIKIVLTPLESKINKEEAKLIFVYADDGWEMRVRNGSAKLRNSVRRLLEAREW